MGKKKKEHVTFNRMADKRVRVNKKSFISSKDNKNFKYKNENQVRLVLNKMNNIIELAKNLETIMWEAAKNHDQNAFLDVVAEDAVMVCGGYRCSGKEYSEFIKDECISLYEILTFEVTLHTTDLIQVHYVVNVDVANKENIDFAGKFHVTSTWRKVGEIFKLVFNMDSRIME